MENIIQHFKNLLNKKRLNKIGPGESFKIKVPVPPDSSEGRILLRYNDEFGNEYETTAIFSLKDKKIIRQDFKIIKKVKDLSDIPKLEIKEDSIIWPDIK